MEEIKNIDDTLKPKIILAIIKEIQAIAPHKSVQEIKRTAEKIYDVMKLDGTIKTNPTP